MNERLRSNSEASCRLVDKSGLESRAQQHIVAIFGERSGRRACISVVEAHLSYELSSEGDLQATRLSDSRVCQGCGDSGRLYGTRDHAQLASNVVIEKFNKVPFYYQKHRCHYKSVRRTC